MRLILILSLFLFGACASPAKSTLVPAVRKPSIVAVMPIKGTLGDEAEQLLRAELAELGIAVVERSVMRALIAKDPYFANRAPDDVRMLNQIGEELDVSFVFSGSVMTDRPAMAAFPFVFITLKLVEVETGEARWIGDYGDAVGTWALSTKGDLKRGVRQLAKEFAKSGGAAILGIVPLE